MVFEIANKIALITGGASGIGLCFAREVLHNGGKGVAIADINSELGNAAKLELEKIFGANRCIFTPTDVTDRDQLENAFLKTIEHFGSIDMLFNNAGVPCGQRWERGIAIDLNGTIHGMLLGFDKYLPKYKQNYEAVIINISSISGVNALSAFPIYSAIKSAIISMVNSWGNHEFYEETKVRVVGICPGVTTTPMLQNNEGFLGAKYANLSKQFEDLPVQEPDFVAKETMKVIKFAPNGTVWVIEGGEPAYEYPFPDRRLIKKKFLQSE